MNNEIIKNTVKDILEKLGVAYDDLVIIEEEKTGTPKFTIKTKESGMLIGPKGEHFMALNHLIKKIVSKKLGDDSTKLHFIVDVNDYHEDAMKEIKNMAIILAERARSFKRDIPMEPMSSYERMIVHSVLEGYPEIKTESDGFGRERKIIIKYIAS